MPEREIRPMIRRHLRRMESNRFGWLRFEPVLERQYRDDKNNRGRIMGAQGLLLLAVYDLFLICDYLMAPQNFMHALAIRIGLFTPIALAAALFIATKRGNRYRDFVTGAVCLLGGLCILLLHMGEGNVYVAENEFGLAIVCMAMNCLLGIDLMYALLTTALIAIVNAVWLFTNPALEASHRGILLGLFGWILALSVSTNYVVTHERRYSYLLQLRGRMQRGMLAEANAELLTLSSTDRLTGLPNRRAYDKKLQEMWNHTRDHQLPLSAVMVDVDHFKQLNDNFGHPYGDRVLQRIASLLQQALRREDDFVARFGGEEFVVLLPNTNEISAVKVAERIRTLVQVAGSPAPYQHDPGLINEVWSTVSCGVASVWPAADRAPLAMIAEADAALYRAKQAGRNCVCSSRIESWQRTA